MIKNWETKVWMWEIKKDLYGHTESLGECCAVRRVSCCAQLLNGFEITMRTLDVFGNLGTVIGKSDDLSVSLGK